MTIKIKSLFHTNKLAMLVSVALLTACSGGNEGDTAVLEEISGIKVSLTDFRYGVQSVGSRTPQTFKISNVGVDTYPINDIAITGDNPEDFLSEVPQGIVLEPGDELQVDVEFSPLGDGQRVASLDIDYDTITGVGSNRAEAVYYTARDFEEAGDYVTASTMYRQYLNSNATTRNKARAMIKLPLLEEADIYGSGSDFGLYKTALDKRDAGDTYESLQLIDVLIRQHNDSYLVDDAKYMRAYIQMVDLGEYQLAHDNFQRLLDEHPDSSYVDTALYSMGLAQHELGNLAEAEQIFIELKDRHTGVKLDLFELQWPKDNYVSRIWFDKTEKQLEELQAENVATPDVATPDITDPTAQPVSAPEPG